MQGSASATRQGYHRVIVNNQLHLSKHRRMLLCLCVSVQSTASQKVGTDTPDNAGRRALGGRVYHTAHWVCRISYR